jgi:hypothetical protein
MDLRRKPECAATLEEAIGKAGRHRSQFDPYRDATSFEA